MRDLNKCVTQAPASVSNQNLTGRIMADNLNKRPRKGILKNSSSFDTQETHSNAKKNKETKWDEMNIIATLHPPDKDYGHMKIEEPKTPYNYQDPGDLDELDASDLAERIRLGGDKLPKAMDYESDEESEEEELTPEELEKRKEFENRRKMHYNEFYAVKIARKLLEEEEDEDEDEKEENDKVGSASSVDNEKHDSAENRP